MTNSNLPSRSELSDNLTNVLRSAFSNNFPGALITVLDALTPPSDPDLLIPDGKSFPLFFSQNPDENFPNIIGKYVDFLTTSSEPNIVASDDQPVKASWGRHGSDNLIGYDPATNHSGKQKIDVFTGDFTDELLLSGQVDNRTRSQWPDRFILGDWQQPYYVEDETSNFGLNQFAFITDFNPTEDIIQLHGTAEDYELVDTDLGTAIFWRKETGYDLVGLVAKTSNLNLEGDYFDFKGNTPPAGAVIDKAIQIGTNGIDFLFASTVDAEGNLYVGGGTGGSLAGTNVGARDAWLTKYDSQGKQVWSKQFGTTGTETSWSMASDGKNIYVAGNTAGTLGSTSQGGRDLYLAKYDSDGNQQWIKQFGTVTFDEAFRVTTDTNGNVYVGGHTVGGLAGENKNVGQDPKNLTFPTTDSFVAKFDSSGNQLWVQQFGTTELDDDWGVTTDKDGNVFAGGNTRGDFGGKNAGFYDNWLVKLDKTDGNKLWVKQFGTSNYDFLWDLKTDSTGNVYATGYTLGDLGGENAGSSDIWLAKFDNDGNQLWIKQFGTSGDDAPFFDGLEVDSNDNVFLTGYTDSNLGGTNAGSYDAWVTKYDKDGNQLWLKQFGTPDYDTATTVSADGYGNVYVSGITDGSLGGVNAGSYDAWVVKLDTDDGTIQDYSINNRNEVIYGGSQAEKITTGNGNDTIYGNGGEDTLIAGNGDNLVVGASQADIITTGNGNDTIYGNGGEDTLIAGDGDNLVVGASQADKITTGNGNDTIYGNGGEDTLIAGDGDNLVYGASQADIITTGNGNDTIYGNGGEDTLIAGDGDNLVFGGSQAEIITTGNGNDTIYGNDGHDILIAGDGDNLVFGGSQADIITTGNGNDTIYGNGGGDYINSGAGLDTIWLGTESATVVLQIGEGYDNINNFQLGATKFKVSSLDNLSFTDSNGSTQILQGNDLLAVVSWQNSNTFSSNFDAIFVA
ncbi:MAG: SBBP repeat-containing protein [Nostoc sp. DedVER02]|uniref:SBBP repeat-containing protein n=1 Tax=unclassified Nostoc TaxID=2593658 RepID=UPI002AD4B181|nr:MULTISPECIES: SBBP repeat-containing protein [unclassified Nostoc]MDZ7985766.1 SBBP repeat-containing protein [Nostoc sp. DedVER02]MDZ8114842.1 SBBP repeat-containing protein [Nostoc sp. DedVER01b]